MAGEGIWLKVAAGLPHSDGAGILERRLEVDRAWSYALSTWDWFVAKHPEGQVVGPDAAFLISRGAGWQGEPDKFCSAMVAASYLAVIPEGFRVRGWKKWAGFHLDKQTRDAERKRKSRGGPEDVPVTSQGQASENKAPSGPCPHDPSPLSSLSSFASEGVKGEARPKPPPGAGPESYPLTAAVLAACWERGWEAQWPKGTAAGKQVEKAIEAVGITAAVQRLMAHVEAERAARLEPRPWLGWHLEVINPRPKPETQGRPDPSQMDYSKPPEF